MHKYYTLTKYIFSRSGYLIVDTREEIVFVIWELAKLKNFRVDVTMYCIISLIFWMQSQKKSIETFTLTELQKSIFELNNKANLKIILEFYQTKEIWARTYIRA